MVGASRARGVTAVTCYYQFFAPLLLQDFEFLFYFLIFLIILFNIFFLIKTKKKAKDLHDE